MKWKLSADHINSLILDYLVDSGYEHSAFTLENELKVNEESIQKYGIKSGDLINHLFNSRYYMYADFLSEKAFDLIKKNYDNDSMQNIDVRDVSKVVYDQVFNTANTFFDKIVNSHSNTNCERDNERFNCDELPINYRVWHNTLREEHKTVVSILYGYNSRNVFIINNPAQIMYFHAVKSSYSEASTEEYCRMKEFKKRGNLNTHHEQNLLLIHKATVEISLYADNNENESVIVDASLSTTENILAVAYSDCRICLHRTNENDSVEFMFELNNLKSAVLSMRWSKNSELLVCSYFDGIIEVFSIVEKSKLFSFRPKSVKDAECMLFLNIIWLSDDKFLTFDNLANFYEIDLSARKVLYTQTFSEKSVHFSFSLSVSRKYIGYLDERNAVNIIDRNDQILLFEIEFGKNYLTKIKNMFWFTTNDNKDVLLIASEYKNFILVYIDHLQSEPAVCTASTKRYKSISKLNVCRYCPDLNSIIFAFNDGSIYLHNLLNEDSSFSCQFENSHIVECLYNKFENCIFVTDTDKNIDVIDLSLLV